MCGRLVNTMPIDAMARLFDAVPSNDLPDGDRYNVCPTNQLTTAVTEGGQRRLRAMRWGFMPKWYKTPTDGPLLINARAETVAEKPAFREAVRERRCIVPADGFYEWTKGPEGARLPWFIHPADGGPMALAGIWQDWERDGEAMTTVAIVTCAAGNGMEALHSRMPVILAPEDWPLWLGESGKGAARLMRPAPDGSLAWHRVDPEVNSNRAQGAHLIEPLAA
ncbi:SOS response-associated peptidase [Tropicimonas isoalkanivorans]|uniref:Abasic site processing protein n=1 Tax=Tropicimonas isoalkanivorans TaxID=441112 RepID=A0A1I1QW24_9RHOB|nr:SOS response-associated peptidase [Tropicimonas isoalkanivorans]SFD23473.1 Putative SOS response-associated peptidase YedK [Tropicimonas isoalkanivorans]